MPYDKTGLDVGETITEAAWDQVEQGIADAHAGDIDDEAIDTDQLADSAVEGPKIASGAVSETKVAADAIGTVKIQDGAVSPEKTSFAQDYGSGGAHYSGAVTDVESNAGRLPSGWSVFGSGSGFGEAGTPTVELQHNLNVAQDEYALIVTPIDQAAHAHVEHATSDVADIYFVDEDGNEVAVTAFYFMLDVFG